VVDVGSQLDCEELGNEEPVDGEESIHKSMPPSGDRKREQRKRRNRRRSNARMKKRERDRDV